MRANAGIFIIICLLFLVGTVGAVGIPDTVTVSTNKPWIVANNVDTSTITVTVMNTTFPDNGPVQGVTVNLAVDPLYGTLTPTTVTTDGSGKASSTFKVKTKSGAPQITATITAPALSNFTIQNIDHEVPVIVNLQYPLEGEVASEVPFNISVIDRWGNPIDGRNTPIHSVSLRIDGPDTYCGFKDGSLYPQTLTRTLDINGNQSVQVRLSKKIGAHNIQVASPFTMGLIYGIATGVPYSMTGSISDGGELPANNINKFVIDYFLYDIYGNPVQNRSLLINTNLTDELTPYKLTTNSLGQIQMTYGPKISILTAKITAISIDNASVRNEIIAKFINSVPENMILAIAPQTMASRELRPSQTAQVIGKVSDSWGNPVPGQVVNFRITNRQNGTYLATEYPSFISPGGLNPTETANATTDNNGNAIVTFYPGSFANWNEPGYSYTASGSCNVIGTWNFKDTHPIKLEWKNYPYLSITTNVSPKTVRVNDTIDVTIRVTGDGYKMKGGPVTAMLDMDASSSLNGASGTDKRGVEAKAAAIKFVENFSTTQDQIGLVSFGDGDNEVLHWDPTDTTSDYALLKNAINNLTLKGGVSDPSNSTKTITIKESVDEAVSRIIHNPIQREGEVRAIILLGDSTSTTWDTDVPAMIKETWGNVTYGNDGNNIRVFTITFLASGGGCGSGHSNVEKDMKLFAPYAGGKDFCGESKEEIDGIFAEIANILRDLAGVNATMNLNFEKVNVNSTQMSGGDVFDYVPVNHGDTSDSRTTIHWQNDTWEFKDQSNEWTAANKYQLKFNIGTMKIDDVWEATFQLKVKKEGQINLFNCTSSDLSFNNGTGNQTMCIPDTYILSISNITPIGVKSGTLDVSDLMLSGTIIDSIPVKWNLYYNGSAKATQTISYSYNNGPWATFDTRTNIPSSAVVGTYYAQLNVQGKEGTYRIRVRAMAPDAPDDEMIIGTPPFAKRNATLILQ